MNNEFGADLITLIDDEGVEHEFEILDEIDNDDGVFYALLPTFDDPQSELESEGTYYIFEAIEEDGEQQSRAQQRGLERDGRRRRLLRVVLLRAFHALPATPRRFPS